MALTQHMAKHLRDVHFGGNWTSVNYKAALKDLTWQQATTSMYDFNTIATLTYHTAYYVGVVIEVLQGKPLNAKDKYSFNLPPVNSQAAWQQLLDTVWANAETLAALIEQLPDSALEQDFADGKHGSLFRNINGLTEHLHYHLGQIVLIRKWLPHADPHPPGVH